MGRPSKKRVRGVFKELLAIRNKKSEWDVFIDAVKSEDKKVKALIEEYKKLIQDTDFMNKLLELSRLERLIMQHNCMKSPEIKYNTLPPRGDDDTEYIIARAAFVNKNWDRQEVRVYLGKLDWKEHTLDELIQNAEFARNAEKAIVNAMKELMKED